ncbi:calcium-binding protein, partial [Methylobrevis pamukkalensis]|uniref:calcium-binding protein n=1 Tax=Methylobrevis pamukkalensis TaxID=1439726 RepID=UPI001FD89431
TYGHLIADGGTNGWEVYYVLDDEDEDTDALSTGSSVTETFTFTNQGQSFEITVNIEGVTDPILGTDDVDVLVGGNGDDVIFGFDGNDTLLADVSTDADYADILYGGRGDDRLVGLPSNSLHDNTATDTAVFLGQYNDYSLISATEVVYAPTGETDTILNVDAYVFGAGGDVVEESATTVSGALVLTTNDGTVVSAPGAGWPTPMRAPTAPSPCPRTASGPMSSTMPPRTCRRWARVSSSTIRSR